MGSIYSQSKPVKFASHRQKQYFSAKKTDRKVVKREQNLQLSMCDWLRDVLPPKVHFRSDTGSGAFNSENEKQIHNRMQSSPSQPDISIFAARHNYHGLVIELKDEGVHLKKSRDGTKIIVKRKKVQPTKKHPEGWKIIERDYKIRMKGDWATLHIEKQANVLHDYKEQGYCASFAVGEAQFKKLVCWYFDIPYLESVEMF